MDVVIVESPAKAKTINKYLGPGYKVLASYGHIRDLPPKDGSVLPDHDFQMAWEVDGKSQRHLRDITAAVKDADRLILATDPDREGEAISWHVLEVLREKKALKDKPVARVVFNAITKKAILDAMAQPRDLDMELVEAYLARRALDYLVGFTLSPVLWRKLPGSRSAGRVQSVALRLVCEREMEIEKFVAEEYWSIEADMATANGDAFTARLHALNGEKLDKFSLGNEEAAKRAVTAVERGGFTVASVEAKPGRRNPPPPFTTSTMQQEAARKLGFSAKRTMQAAQRLYEGTELGGETVGLITYMRTDGVQVTPEALDQTRKVIAARFGDSYLPASAREYKTKAKNAQEAHEAVRPTSLERLPDNVAGFLEADQKRLYDLIWKRTMASQMESARVERTTADLASADGQAVLRATGQVILFDGFLALYQEGRDDSEEEDSRRLPAMAQGEPTRLDTVTPSQHFTEPPPRYTEATLVKKMEELGIGRPSTYASILEVLRARSYVVMDRNRFVPEDKGRLVTAFLESFFTRYVEYDFTADLEGKLDLVSSGDLAWKDLLREFWQAFIAKVDETSDLRVSQVLDALNDILGPHIFPAKEDGSPARACPACADGELSLKLGRYGAFIGCSNYPECNFTRALAAAGEDGDAALANEPKVLGTDPESGEDVTMRTGRFGPYVQLGEGADGEKPKRSSIPKDMQADLDFDRALALLSLPRDVGSHPEDGEMIQAGLGRYGPYLKHGSKYANLESVEDLFTIGINRAVTVLAEKKSRPRRGEAKALKELGEHPEDGNPVRVLDGRYGPYVNHNKVNATIPKGTDPQDVTMEQAVTLLNDRAAKTGKKTSAKKKAAPKKKAAAKKKTTAKKAAPKKKAATKKKAAAKKKTAKATEPDVAEASE